MAEVAVLAQQVIDLKRKLRMIKTKLLNPSEANIKTAIMHIDDAFSNEETQESCNRFGINYSPSPCFSFFPYPATPSPTSGATTPHLLDAATQTETETPSSTATTAKTTVSTQTTCSGENGVTKTALYNSTQANIRKAMDILSESWDALNDREDKRKKSLESDKVQKSKSIAPGTKRKANVPDEAPILTMERVHYSSQPMLESGPIKLALGDGICGGYTPAREKNYDMNVAEKRQRITTFELKCNYCKFSGKTENELKYHTCNPVVSGPYSCCKLPYKKRGYYLRHRMKMHNPNGITLD